MKIQEKKVGVVDPDFPQKRLEFPRFQARTPKTPHYYQAQEIFFHRQTNHRKVLQMVIQSSIDSLIKIQEKKVGVVDPDFLQKPQEFPRF